MNTDIVLYYNNYYFKLKASDELKRCNYEDLTLSVYDNNNRLLKEYKVEYDNEYYYKILKTKVKASNILELFMKINSDIHISKIFFNKLIEEVQK